MKAKKQIALRWYKRNIWSGPCWLLMPSARTPTKLAVALIDDECADIRGKVAGHDVDGFIENFGRRLGFEKLKGMATDLVVEILLKRGVDAVIRRKT